MTTKGKYKSKFALTPDGLKLCRECERMLPASNFSVNKVTGSGLSYDCRECKNSRRRTEYAKRPRPTNSHLRLRYGITIEEYQSMYDAQDGKCSICDKYFDQLMTDHCHTTGAVRGLLCHNCNVGLGWFKDDISSLRSAIKYLVRTNSSRLRQSE